MLVKRGWRVGRVGGGGALPADAVTPTKVISSLDSRMKLLCYFLPLLFLFSLSLEAFLHLGSAMGLPALVTSKPVALNGISLQPLPTLLSHCSTAPSLLRLLP